MPTTPAYDKLIDLDRLEVFLQNLESGGGSSGGTVVYDDAEEIDGSTVSASSSFTLEGAVASARLLVEYKVRESPGLYNETIHYGSAVVPVPQTLNDTVAFETGTWTWGVSRAYIAPVNISDKRFRFSLGGPFVFTGATAKDAYVTILRATEL